MALPHVCSSWTNGELGADLSERWISNPLQDAWFQQGLSGRWSYLAVECSSRVPYEAWIGRTMELDQTCTRGRSVGRRAGASWGRAACKSNFT